MTVINESGIYTAILKSNIPDVKVFKRWVTSVVLPSIRTTGGYIAGQEDLSPEKYEKLKKEVEELSKKVEKARKDWHRAVGQRTVFEGKCKKAKKEIKALNENLFGVISS